MNHHLTADRPETSPLAAELSEFEVFERLTSSRSQPWLRALRTTGISHFAEQGFPSTDREEWRFTNPAPLIGFGFERARRDRARRPQDIRSLAFRDLECHRLVFLDGQFSPELSEVRRSPRGAYVGSLAEALGQGLGWLEDHLGRHLSPQSCPFAALNTAFVEDGALVRVPEGLSLEEPVHMLFISTQARAVSQPRVLVVAEPGSHLRVIEDHASLAEESSLANVVTEIFADENACVEHLKLQRQNESSLHVGSVEAVQRRSSRLLTHSIAVGGRWSRSRIGVRLEGEGCESVLNGLYLASGEQLVDHHTLVDHAQPRCASHEFYHGVLGGRARGVFNGRILVRLDAQKTDAKQTNRNLLLSREATVNAKPQLEIFADDVKCTHGATVGQLDPEALFYLQSRGIGQAQARQMLVGAFASAILNRVSMDPVRLELDRIVSAKLEAMDGAAPLGS